MAVELAVTWHIVIGTHDGGVAPNVTAADIPLFQHRNVGDAVVLGQIIGRRQAMPAAANDHHIIFWLWIRFAPRRPPPLVAAQPFGQHF